MSKAIVWAVTLVSILSAAALGLTARHATVRFTGVLCGVAALAAAIAVTKGKRRAAVAAIAVGPIGAALFGLHLYQASAPAMRMLNVGVALAWGALAIASLVRLTRLTDWSRALLLGFSVAIPLFVADALIEPAPLPQRTPWEVTTRPDPDTGYRYIAHSIARNYYPDNPRGYFEETVPSRDAWSIETHADSDARLEFAAAGEGDVLKVTVQKLSPPAERQPWHVKLQQAPLDIRSGINYMVSFNARAAAPRSISCAVGQNHEPWDLIGKYHEFQVTTDWQRFECPFTAASSDNRARLFFDLAKSDAAVELDNILIEDESTGRPVVPPLGPPKYYVSYRFNALGLRGIDRQMPAPPGTFRIAVLGDSYAMGVGVREEHTVAVQLEQRLNAAASAGGDKRTYEVLNDGVSGYDTRQARMSFEKYSSKYEPQVVVLLMVFNDDLSYNEELARGPAANPAAAGRRVFNLLGRVEQMASTREYDYSGSVYQVRQLNEAVKKRGAKLLVGVFRNSGDFTPWQQLLDAVNTGLKGTGIPVVDLGNAILTGRDEKALLVHAIDGHPNEIAHRLAAEEIERVLRAERMLP